MGEDRVLKAIQKWENEISSYVANDFEQLYELWIENQFSKLPTSLRKKLIKSIDDWFIYTYTFLQGTNTQTEEYNRVLQFGRTYDERIEKVEDLKTLSIEKLTYLANQQVAKNRVYSFIQGGITGSGGWLFLGADLPLLTALNLRTLQLIGTCFGYNMNNPIEMVLALKVLQAGALPRRLQYKAWKDLKSQVKDYNSIMNQQSQLIDEELIEVPAKNIFKTLAIMMFRKKLFQGIPIISIGIGASVNYKTSKEICDFATRFYQYRYIKEKGSDS
ncbi:EcsC family protein [Alkalibacillus aidingensis]|uniref:EcsC family protein n=1 Tax=Alkalibacillus aidingensis TaxID=2747607 RepID=UPI001660913A|nr:EcsC family protein [Alkalibacillus aidingensis]